MAGWIKIDRGISEHWIWEDAEKLKWWLDLLILAAWEDKRLLVGSQFVDLKRGQLIASLSYLCKRWGRSRKMVESYLSLLVRDGMIRKDVNRNISIVTIVNYERYQDESYITGHLNADCSESYKEQGAYLGAGDGAHLGTHLGAYQGATNKEYKEDKNIRNSFIPNGMCPTGQSDMAEKSEDKDILKDKHYQQIVVFWNRTIRETQSTLPEVKAVSDERKKKMKIRWKEFSEVGDPVEVVRTIFHKVATSKFCQGDNSKGWSASFDWLFGNPKNWVKVYEGNYDDNHADTRNGHQPKGDRMTELVSERNKFQQALNGIIDTIPADGGADYQGEQ